MKKCNFLAVLVTALFMFLGFDISAQYVSNVKAVGLIEQEVSKLKSAAGVPTTQRVGQSNNAYVVNQLKINVGLQLLEPLKAGGSIESVLASVFSKINPGSNTDRRAMVNEVDLFYRSLLKSKPE